MWLVAYEVITLELSPVELFLIRSKQVSAGRTKKTLHRITLPLRWALLSLTWAGDQRRSNLSPAASLRSMCHGAHLQSQHFGRWRQKA